MPCALTSDFAYPDYLKRILKEIENDKDEDLKACACKLKTPTSREGCIILDEDDKVPAFPFCIDTYEKLEDVPEVECPPPPIWYCRHCDNASPSGGDITIPFEEVSQEVKLKDIMKFYWTIKSLKIKFNGKRDPKEEVTLERSADKDIKLVCDKEENYRWGDPYDKLNVLCDESPFNGEQCVNPGPCGSNYCCYNSEGLYADINFSSLDVSTIVQISTESSDKFYIRKPMLSYYKVENSFGGCSSGSPIISAFDTGGHCEEKSFWPCVSTINGKCVIFDKKEFDFGELEIEYYTPKPRGYTNQYGYLTTFKPHLITVESTNY